MFFFTHIYYIFYIIWINLYTCLLGILWLIDQWLVHGHTILWQRWTSTPNPIYVYGWPHCAAALNISWWDKLILFTLLGICIMPKFFLNYLFHLPLNYNARNASTLWYSGNWSIFKSIVCWQRSPGQFRSSRQSHNYLGYFAFPLALAFLGGSILSYHFKNQI